MRRLRGEERADKTCLFHHFHPKSIMPSSPIDLREHLDHGRADPGAARLPRAAGPTMPPRTRIVAPFRPFSACARLHGQQRASGKQRTLSTSRWPWFVLARTPPRRGREEPEAQKHAAGGRSACRRASSEVVPRIRAPRAARTRRRIEVGVLLGYRWAATAPRFGRPLPAARATDGGHSQISLVGLTFRRRRADDICRIFLPCNHDLRRAADPPRVLRRIAAWHYSGALHKLMCCGGPA